MSGVYIKGIKMPETCSECWFCVDGEYCGAIKEYFQEKPDTCPLVAVPDHGDLVEVERAYDEIAEQAGKGNYIDMDAVDAGLQNAPVIIPEERREE